MKSALSSSHPVKRTTSTVWPITTDGVAISSATCAISSINAIRRRTRRRAQHGFLGSRRRCSCSGRSGVAPSTTSCAITSTLAASPTVSSGVTTPSVLGAASSAIGGSVRIAEEATVRGTTAAVSGVSAGNKVMKRARFVVLHQLMSFVSEELWRRMEWRFEATAASQYRDQHPIGLVVGSSRHIIGAGHAA